MKFFDFFFQILLFLLEKYKRDFQMFITIVIKLIMDFFSIFYLKYLYFCLKNWMQDFQMFITIMIKLIIENFHFLFEIF
jgi:hypothetical protein